MGSSQIEPGQKLALLEQLLASSTFGRADQVRNFLRYIGQMEIDGKAREISEYSIGVEALGRQADFVPADDTIVRNRAHALRQKLLEYYAVENPDASVRVELPKGSYVPRFTRIDPPAELHPPVVEPMVVGPTPPARNVRGFGAGFLAASLLAAAAFAALALWQGPSGADPILAEAWGPIASKNSNALVVLGISGHLSLRAFPPGSHPDSPPLDVLAPPEVTAYFSSRFPFRPGDELHMAGTASHRVGEVLGAMEVVKALNSFQSTYHVLPDRAAPVASLRQRNVLMFGDPSLVSSVAMHLQRGVFSMEYDPALRGFVLRERAAKGAQPRVFATVPRQTGDVREIPGLLTILPNGESPDGPAMTVIFSCVNSAGCHAAAEYFCSAKSLRDLKERFRKEGVVGFPKAYQVVIKGRTDGLLLLSYEYAAHRVLDQSALVN